jgi:hypothetical protein
MARTNGSRNGVDSRGELFFRQMSGCLGQQVGGIRAIDLEIQAKLHFLSGRNPTKNNTEPVLFTRALAPLD